MSTEVATPVNAHHPEPDCDCRARAYAFLVEMIGARQHTLTWDPDHCLQGHVHIGGRELVIIAPRDESHQPVLLTESGWDAVRRCPAEQRREMLATYAITDGARLASALQTKSTRAA